MSFLLDSLFIFCITFHIFIFIWAWIELTIRSIFSSECTIIMERSVALHNRAAAILADRRRYTRVTLENKLSCLNDDTCLIFQGMKGEKVEWKCILLLQYFYSGKKKNIKWIQGKRESDETSPPQFKTIYIAHLWTYFYLCMYTHKSPKHLN